MRVQTMEPTIIPRENGIFGLYLIMRNGIFTGVKMRSRMTSHFSKQTFISLTIALFLIMLPKIAFGQQSRSHTVTVIVNPITVMQLSNGTITLNITGANAIAGQDQMSVIDQSSTLLWGTNSSSRKITIRTNLTPQKYSVLAYAVSPTAGSAGIEAPLSTTANNFITGIGRSSGSAGIRYTGIALASQGIGSDSHTITFTITLE
jgi:hypothetical protein